MAATVTLLHNGVLTNYGNSATDGTTDVGDHLVQAVNTDAVAGDRVTLLAHADTDTFLGKDGVTLSVGNFTLTNTAGSVFRDDAGVMTFTVIGNGEFISADNSGACAYAARAGTIFTLTGRRFQNNDGGEGCITVVNGRIDVTAAEDIAAGNIDLNGYDGLLIDVGGVGFINATCDELLADDNATENNGGALTLRCNSITTNNGAAKIYQKSGVSTIYCPGLDASSEADVLHTGGTLILNPDPVITRAVRGSLRMPNAKTRLGLGFTL